MRLRKITSALAASTLALALATTMLPATADAATVVSKEGKKAAKAEFNPDNTYHAYFGLQQTETWIFRDEWYSETLGKTGTKLGDGNNFDGTLFQNGDDGSTPIQGATVTDAEITGNGTYTVGVEGLNGCLTQNQSAVLSMIYVDTDVPVAAKDTFKISDVKLVIDNKTQTLPEKLFYNEEAEGDSGLLRFDPVNTYQKDQGAYPDCPSVVTPNDSIKITFTVSGLSKDNPDAVEATPTPAPKADDASSDSSDSDSKSSISAPVVVGIVVAVVVIAGVVVVVTRKKK